MSSPNPDNEAHSVARALAYVQKNVGTLGIDPARIVIMGHSAGAHLVSLVTARTDIQKAEGVQPWKGTIALDGAMYNPSERMAIKHFYIYDAPFGTDPEFWRLVSPLDQYVAPGAPILLACSTTRPDKPCKQSDTFKKKIESVGGRAEVLPADFGHGKMNNEVGRPGTYTEAIQKFLTSIQMP
jgi:acetyl esterase/lipase